MGFFTIIDYALKGKQAYEAPEDLLSETAFGFIELYFILSFIVLFLLGGGLMTLGIIYSSWVLGVFGFLFLSALGISIFIYIKVQNFFSKMSKKIITETKKGINYTKSKIINIEAEE